VRASFWSLRACCVPPRDGFTWPLRATVCYAADLQSAETIAFLQDTFRQVPLTNIITEDRFSRHRRHVTPSAGHAPSLATIAASHMLSELRSMYAMSCEHWDSVSSERLCEAKAPRLTAYQAFIQSRTKGQRVRVDDAAQEWRAMTAEQQEQFRTHAAPPVRLESVAQPMPSEATPFAVGDSMWPIAPQHLHPVQQGMLP